MIGIPSRTDCVIHLVTQVCHNTPWILTRWALDFHPGPGCSSSYVAIAHPARKPHIGKDGRRGRVTQVFRRMKRTEKWFFSSPQFNTLNKHWKNIEKHVQSWGISVRNHQKGILKDLTVSNPCQAEVGTWVSPPDRKNECLFVWWFCSFFHLFEWWNDEGWKLMKE